MRIKACIAVTARCIYYREFKLILVSAKLGSRTSGGSGLALGMAFGALVAAPFGIAEAGTALLHPAVLIAGLVVALMSSVVPYSLELEALRRMPPRVFGVLMSLEPGMAALAGFVVLGQQLSARAVMGIALVVAASVGASVRARRPPRDI